MQNISAISLRQLSDAAAEQFSDRFSVCCSGRRPLVCVMQRMEMNDREFEEWVENVARKKLQFFLYQMV